VRAQGHQVLIADAAKEQSLLLAGVDRARSLLVLTEVEAHNLHIALVGRRISKHATICARIDSPTLSVHVTATSSILATSPLLMAARAFADEALGRAARAGS
jgi:voltage-gated potassium channel Kch